MHRPMLYEGGSVVLIVSLKSFQDWQKNLLSVINLEKKNTLKLSMFRTIHMSYFFSEIPCILIVLFLLKIDMLPIKHHYI